MSTEKRLFPLVVVFVLVFSCSQTQGTPEKSKRGAGMFGQLDFGMAKGEILATCDFRLEREDGDSSWLRGKIADTEVLAEVSLGIPPGWEGKLAGVVVEVRHPRDEELLKTPMGRYLVETHGEPDEVDDDEVSWEPAWGQISFRKELSHDTPRRDAPATLKYELEFWNREYQKALTTFESSQPSSPVPVPAPVPVPVPVPEQHDGVKRRVDRPDGPDGNDVLGFRLGEEREICKGRVAEGFAVLPATSKQLVLAKRAFGGIDFQVTWRFDEAGQLVEMDAEPLAPCPDVALAESPLYGVLVEGLGWPDAVERDGAMETARWQRGDLSVVYGKHVERVRDGESKIGFDMNAWSVKHREAHEARIRKDAERDTADKVEEVSK